MNYWEKRSGMRYYAIAREMCEAVCPLPGSVLDVGSNGCPHLEWFPDAHRRVSVDISNPYVALGIESARQDFNQYNADRFDLCVCLQVLEHIADVEVFAKKLLSLANHVVISVPYMWPAGASDYHCNDPVSDDKLKAWFGMAPTSSAIVEEPTKRWKIRRHLGIGRTSPKSRRIVNYYGPQAYWPLD